MYAHFLVTFRFAQRDKMNDYLYIGTTVSNLFWMRIQQWPNYLCHWTHHFLFIILECQFTNHKTAYYIGLTSFNRFWFILAVADGFKNLSTLDSPFHINFEFPTSFCRILSFRLTRQVQVLEERTALFHWAVTFHKVKRVHEGWTPQTDLV